MSRHTFHSATSFGIQMMRATESNDQGKAALLTDETRQAIDHWLTKFPEGPEGHRSAIIQSLVAAQHQNGGWLSPDLMEAVSDYLDVPPVWVYEVRKFLTR